MAKFLARLIHKNTTPQHAQVSKGVFHVGAVIDQHYQLEEEIGRGGMGIVYRGYDLHRNRDVAIKVIDENQRNGLTMQQFLRESNIVSRLQHPHIVCVHETGRVHTDTETLPFIVMELLQGTPLHEMHDFTYARILDIGKQICEALDYIHERGFLYRDLKPGNVILEKCGFRYCVKLIDFGLARPRHEAYLPNESTRAGTVFYLAPELIAGKPADTGADLYALGATLYEMITGRVPFSNIDEQNILSQHLQENVSPPSHSRSDVPPALEAIVLRLLEKDPKDRFASAQDVLQAFEGVHLMDANVARGNLVPTNKVGGESAIGQIVKLLESNRMVTVVGDDDTLVWAVGTHVLPEFADGAWVVQLEYGDGPAMVLPTVASVMNVQEDPNRPLVLSLLEALRNRNLLLMLVTCGHVAAACAQLCQTILRTCPEVHILVDSDRPLNIPGEVCFDARNPAGKTS